MKNKEENIDIEHRMSQYSSRWRYIVKEEISKLKMELGQLAEEITQLKMEK
jgi:hypothetical protein